MKNQLVFASANANKVEEVSLKLGGIKLLGLKDIGCTEEVPETSDTLEGNARQKAWYIYEKFGCDCFADDTGLEVLALGGKPGVHSARFAGEQRSNEDNRKKLLNDMEVELDRRARFRTSICLIIGGKETMFEGIVEGKILRAEKGKGGFGYDSLFVPLDNSRSFAEMSIEEKNILSHRGKAIGKLRAFLEGKS
jgi:XTP/dITP diphosphohydrolase